MPKALDITGQRFGKLVALKKVKSRSGKTYWLCQCDCGNQKEIQTTHLTSGVTTSCGCSQGIMKPPEELRTCPICGKIFQPNHYTRKYCFDCIPIGLDSSAILRRKKRLIKDKLIQYKGGKCEICGYNKCQGALQFHHINPKEKEFSLSQVNLNNNSITMEDLYKEVDKCLLLCANCHAEQHYKGDE